MGRHDSNGNMTVAIEIPLGLTFDDVLLQPVDIVITRILRPHWHKVPAKAKQLVGELCTLRTLVKSLLKNGRLGRMILCRRLEPVRSELCSGQIKNILSLTDDFVPARINF